MDLLICDDDGFPLDATIEIETNSIVMQSRGGTKGSARASNTEYSSGLRLLLGRFQKNGESFLQALVDSNRVQNLPIEERVILNKEDMRRSAAELFTLVSKRMQAVGKPSSLGRHTGNANKRIRFQFSNLTIKQLEDLSQGVSKGSALGEDAELSSSEVAWAEGALRLVSHLKRERARGVSRAKKAAFLRDNGTLFCERCSLDPIITYGDDAAEACIEVHHNETAVSDMEVGHLTQLEDLQCLCANCHRFVHALLKKEAKTSTF
ncbi:MAG: hypothetical protein ABJ360_17395 [Roseobacter sp.]